MKKKQVKRGFVESVVLVLEGALNLSRAFERLLVDVVAAFVPWLAPIIPAYLAYDNIYNQLHLPLPVAVIGAIVVECLGLATVTTVVQFDEFNSTKGNDDKSAPFLVAAGTAIFYLIVVLTVNAMLDNSDALHKVTKGMLSTLSVAGALTISLRGQHARRLTAKLTRDEQSAAKLDALEKEEREFKRKEKEERRKERFELKKLELEKKVSEPAESFQKVSQEAAKVSEEQWTDWRHVPQEERLKIATMKHWKQVQKAYPWLIEKTAQNWLKRAAQESGIVGEVAQFHQHDEVSDASI
jgi:hypothetical protein